VQNNRIKPDFDLFYKRKAVDRVHNPWTTALCRSTVDLRAECGWSSPERGRPGATARRWSPRVAGEGEMH
jgi:hypothetical protein